MNFRIIKRTIIDLIHTCKLYKYYTKTDSKLHNPEKNSVIIMYDGKMNHGGLSDRLWGILSIYRYCRDYNKKFKILFEKPFRLQNFLIPNEVDWTIKPEEVIYDFKHSFPIYISLMTHDQVRMYEILRNKLKSRDKQQHIYTNTRIISKKEFGSLYHSLFKMSDELERQVDINKKRIGESYVAVTFRFQQLLGDFKEGNFKVIQNARDRNQLIEKCKNVVVKLRDHCNSSVLVTSDSMTFLNIVSKEKNIFIIEGEIIHPDFDKRDNVDDIYLKSFLDLYMIAEADQVYLCNIPPLYRSGFPETAACINDKAFYEITDYENLNIRRWD